MTGGKVFALFAILYFLVGFGIAVCCAFWDIVHGEYTDDYWVVIIGWPIVILSLVILAPYKLFTILMDKINEAWERTNRDG